MPKTNGYKYLFYYNVQVLLYMHIRTQAKLLAMQRHDHVNQTVLDAMHAIKDCIEKIVYLVTGNIMHTFI